MKRFLTCTNARVDGLVRLLCVMVLAVIAGLVARRAFLVGDGLEYLSMLESLWKHGSPNQTHADFEGLADIITQSHYPKLQAPVLGFYVAPDGHWYAYHFWAYSLLGIPAKGVLHALHVNEIGALAWTNAVLLVATVAYALRKKADATRIVLVALSVAGPVIWYVAWPHAEVFAWSCVVLSLVALDDGKYGRATLFAAFGAMQVAPILALALVVIGLAAADRAPGRKKRVAICLGAGSLALAPTVFFYLAFKVPNLIVATGLADPRLASVSRIASLAIDLDQGMLVFVPATLGLGLLGLAIALRARRWTVGAIGLAALAMMALAAQTANFNSACAGMIRYDVWIMPLFAWLAAHGIPWAKVTRSRRIALAVGALAQVAIVASGAIADDEYEHGRLASAVLTHTPELYSPEPEVFAERTLKKWIDVPGRGAPLPIAFFGQAGATKILVDAPTLDTLPEIYEVDNAWFRTTKKHYAHAIGPFYLEPPAYAVKPRAKRTSVLAFGDGWSWPEHDATDGWRWMSERGSFVVRTHHGVARQLRLHGWVPEELDTTPVLTIYVDGKVADRFTAPRQRFDRWVPVTGDMDEIAEITIETSSTARPPKDERALGFALLDAQLAPTKPSLGAPYVHVTGDGWRGSFPRDDIDAPCLDRRGTLAIDRIPGGERGAIVLGGWVAAEKIGRPTNLRIFVDDAEVDDLPIFRHFLRRIPIRADRGHAMRLEVDVTAPTDLGDVGLCLEALRVESGS